MLNDSPWAQHVGSAPDVLVYFATAQPIELAQAEANRRYHTKPAELDADYTNYLKQHRADSFILAIPYASLSGLGSASDDRKLQDETVMKAGHQTYHFAGYFPPTPRDPVLRLVFPRKVQVSDKSVVFELYLPGIPLPRRDVEFTLKDMVYHGKLEM